MFHLVGSTNLLGTVANTDVPAITDDSLTIQNTHLFPGAPMQVVGMFAASATLSRARLNSPKMRQISPVYIRPINVGTLPANNPNVDIRINNPFVINALEELQIEATSGIAMGTERFTALLWLQMSYEPPPMGDIYRLRWTSTTAAVANAWTSIVATYEQQLPAGRYAVVDSEAQSTNAIAHRLIFDQQYWRPGTLSLTSLANRNPYAFGRGMLGKWGEFLTQSLPRFQVLCNAADAAHEGYLSVVKIG